MSELNQKQQDLLIEAMRRRKEAIEEANAFRAVTKKPSVSPDEYARRLNAQIGFDASIASDLRKQRIDAARETWRNMVGKRFADAKIDDPEIAEKVNIRVRRIVNNGPLHRNSMVLTGHLGVGKTWTGYAYASQLIAEGVLQPGEILLGTEIGLLTPLALATYDRTEKIQELLGPQHKFFFIDEVGRATFKSQELRHEIWYAIINHAYENHIPVVLTTNKSSKTRPVRDAKANKEYNNELEMWIGEAAYDRLKYMAHDGVIVPGEINKRPEVNDQLDGDYESKPQQGTATAPMPERAVPPRSTGAKTAAKSTPGSLRPGALKPGKDNSPF